MSIRVALSAMPGEGFRAATLPLFTAGAVDSLEWTCELGFSHAGIAPELDAVLGAYASAGALSFHGVSASPLGATPRSFRATCAALRELAKRHRPIHVSEHFAFASGEGFRRAAPMPVPFTQSTVGRAQERLVALADAAEARVGIENLAFAFSARDVDAEPSFLDAIVRPLDTGTDGPLAQATLRDPSGDGLRFRETGLLVSPPACERPRRHVHPTRAPLLAALPPRRLPSRVQSEERMRAQRIAL